MLATHKPYDHVGILKKSAGFSVCNCKVYVLNNAQSERKYRTLTRDWNKE